MSLENLSKNEIEGMTFADLAYSLLKNEGECNTAVLYKKIVKLKGMNKQQYEDTIADFFAILNTDKRFIVLPSGIWGLKENHAVKTNFNELLVEEDNEMLIDEEHIEDEVEDEEIELFVSDEDEFDDTDDGMADLVIIDEDELLEE